MLTACGILVFGLTWLATAVGWNGTIQSHSAFETAATQSVLVLATTLPSLLVALAIVEGRMKSGRWRPTAPGSLPTAQYASAFVAGYVVALPLVALYFFYYFYSIGTSDANALYLFRLFASLYAAYAVLGGIQAVFAAYAASEVAIERPAVALGTAAAHAAAAMGALAILYVWAHGMLGYPRGWTAVADNGFDIVRIGAVSLVATYIVGRTSHLDDDASDDVGAVVARETA